jgi:hypothetical protein
MALDVSTVAQPVTVITASKLIAIFVTFSEIIFPPIFYNYIDFTLQIPFFNEINHGTLKTA